MKTIFQEHCDEQYHAKLTQALDRYNQAEDEIDAAEKRFNKHMKMLDRIEWALIYFTLAVLAFGFWFLVWAIFKAPLVKMIFGK
jgi:hypothetical protein